MPVITELEPVALSADCPEQQGLYPIREVARLTGINPVTLRAWERRYGLIQPTRTISGHRLYSVTDIETVRRVMGWLERGVAVSKVAQLLANDSAHERPQPVANEHREWQCRAGAALSAFNEPELERLYGQIYSGYPAETVFQDIFLPLWQQLLRGRDEFGRTSEWLMLDGFLRARVQHRLQMQAAQAAQCVVMVAVPELCHELELEINNDTVLTHAEAASRDQYGPGQGDPDMRWDLYMLKGMPETRALRPGGVLLRKKALAYLHSMLRDKLLQPHEAEVEQPELLAA